MKKERIYGIVKNRIKDELLIEKGDEVILGLSGGADSMCLFAILLDLRKSLGFNLHVVHVNHLMRGKDSDADQAFVEEVTTRTGVEGTTFRVDCKKWAEVNDLTIEEAGREIRYRAFSNMATQLVKRGKYYENIKVAVAHNLDDQAETVLLKILRGTGLEGFGGMDYKRDMDDGVKLIRPIMDLERKDIEEFCKIRQIPYRDDKTNFETEFTRNKLRLQLIPFIKANFNENFPRTIVKNSELARKDREYIWAKTSEDYKNALEIIDEFGIKFKRYMFIRSEEPVRNRIIMNALRNLGLKKGVGKAHFIGMNEKLDNPNWEGIITFPKGYIVDVSKNFINVGHKRWTGGEVLLKKEAPDKPRIALMAGQAKGYKHEAENAVFDYDLFLEDNKHIKDPVRQITVRTKETGDVLPLKRGAGRKKLQDVFVDAKIPREERDNIWLVAIGGEVLWIPGGKMLAKYSGKYPITKNTKRILVLKKK